jgi:DNA (cytosine-5)-methyltransferase 1
VKIGSLFSGYGGLDMAVQSHFGGQLAWYSEIEPAACKVLATLHPDVPNIGDITKVDWSQVEPVDIITGGYPCQPFSSAGMRKGKNDERHLWPYVRDALSAIRPRFAVLENVRGHITLGFGDVLADLAHMGWDARWGLVRAAEAGAPHNRARLFIVAYPDSSGRNKNVKQSNDLSAKTSKGKSSFTDGHCSDRSATDSYIARCDRQNSQASPTQAERSRHIGKIVGPLITNPQSSDAQELDVERQGNWQLGRLESRGDTRENWGKYSAAIEKWERVTRSFAPSPTIPYKDRARLNPAFVEWMMGLPAGHVTGHGLSTAQELKMLGNGVVPQQAALALQLLAVST